MLPCKKDWRNIYVMDTKYPPSLSTKLKNSRSTKSVYFSSAPPKRMDKAPEEEIAQRGVFVLRQAMASRFSPRPKRRDDKKRRGGGEKRMFSRGEKTRREKRNPQRGGTPRSTVEENKLRTRWGVCTRYGYDPAGDRGTQTKKGGRTSKNQAASPGGRGWDGSVYRRWSAAYFQTMLTPSRTIRIIHFVKTSTAYKERSREGERKFRGGGWERVR